ncbi:MAG: UDP-N-acetylmuramate dehydrogenase [Betaproteobacteria bacterium]|nr:UDP-N-acetylmuramate dehydrogenase [Betaproteobacteria bacterium]
MNMSEPMQFRSSLRGQLLRDERMARHVSWRAGGNATLVYAPADLADLQGFMAEIPAEREVCFVGLGSNFLVREGGFDGVIVLMHNTRGVMRTDGDLVYSEAGVASPKVARFAANHSYVGAEFLAGIPGTIGGALAMNAGCYGAETWDVVDHVQTIDRQGVLHSRARSDFYLAYRHCEPTPSREEFFTAAWMRFGVGDREAARERIKVLLTQRANSQPLTLPNAGSVFRNPEGDFAARLIEACGLRGFAIGGARISEKHANFIVNPKRQGSATDIEALIHHARATVLTRFGIALVPEVRIIGRANREMR